MRPNREETETEFWLKARSYWAEKADLYAKFGLVADFERAMSRLANAVHNFSDAARISDCGCLPGGCNYDNAYISQRRMGSLEAKQ